MQWSLEKPASVTIGRCASTRLPRASSDKAASSVLHEMPVLDEVLVIGHMDPGVSSLVKAVYNNMLASSPQIGNSCLVHTWQLAKSDNRSAVCDSKLIAVPKSLKGGCVHFQPQHM